MRAITYHPRRGAVKVTLAVMLERFEMKRDDEIARLRRENAAMRDRLVATGKTMAAGAA